MKNILSNLLAPRSILLALSSSLLAFSAEAASPAALTYRGVLSRVWDEPMTGVWPITFSVYDSLRPDTLLWRRTIPTKVKADGTFYTEISDDAAPATVLHDVTLADALSSTKGVPEIAVSMDGGATEMKPRQRLATWVRATRALRTRGVDLAVVENNAVVPGAAGVNELYAKRVTVAEDSGSGFPDQCHLLPMRSRLLGGTGSAVTVKDIRLSRPAWPAMTGTEAFTGKAACDAIATYENADGAFSLIVPGGGTIVGDGGTNGLQTVRLSTFGAVK